MTNSHMTISESGLSLIREFEGRVLTAYQDVAGVWTIGYGHTSGVRRGHTISEAEADRYLRGDVEKAEDVVRHYVEVDLSQNEFNALVSFVFNIGARNFICSTALKRLNHGDRKGAAEALTWFNKAKVRGHLKVVDGLTRRRMAEREMFLGSKNAGN